MNRDESQQVDSDDADESHLVLVDVHVEQVLIYCFCATCHAYFAPSKQCPECNSGRVFWLVSRDMKTMLRRALEHGEIEMQQDLSEIELMMSTEKKGGTRSLVLDVLNNSRPLVRIVIAALMHSPNEHQQPMVELCFRG